MIRELGKALIGRHAAVFVGAGLSIPAGFVDWRNLLREIADDLNLDIDKESDLISVAQFHKNHTGNTGMLTQALLEEFTKDASITENHRLLATLPVDIIWTTNYDTLIEDALKEAGRRPVVKHSQVQLKDWTSRADVTVLKMHGDVSLPDEVVITRDDYEAYSLKRQLFSERLKGDLVSKTFLFLGFSFTDPNIDYILSRIRILLGEHVRNHFCIMKKPTPYKGSSSKKRADHDYDIRRLELRMEDLKRYGIQTVLVDEYTDITRILDDLNKASHRKDVFVSGSVHEYAPLGKPKVDSLCTLLGKNLIGAGLNLVNGFGLGIGGPVAMSAMEAVYQKSGERLEDRVLLRPFPQTVPAHLDRAAVWSRYRLEMISQAGHAIFLCGNKVDSATSTIVKASGMREEFEIARALGKTLIPIGATGWVAQELWEEVTAELATLFPGVDVNSEFATLGSQLSSEDELVKAVLGIIKKASR